MAVFKATSTLVMLFEADTDEQAAEILAGMGVGDIAYAIEEGNACGMMKDEHLVEVPTEQIKNELLAVGNDGTFFSVDSEKEGDTTMNAEWTPADSLVAQREGWNLFDTGPDYGMQVQRYDNAGEIALPDGSSPPQLFNDWEAHRLVREGAARGSITHAKALALVGAEERDTILRPAD